MVFGPNGNLFAGSNNAVFEYNGTTGAFVRTFVPAFSGGLNDTTGLVFGPNGDLFASGNGGLWEYNGTTGAFVKPFVPPGLPPVVGLGFGPNGDLFASTFFNKVLEFNATTGAFVGNFVPSLVGGGTGGLTFGANGDLFVSNNDSVLEYNGTTGAFVTTFVPQGRGGLESPFGLAFGPTTAPPTPSVPEPSTWLLLGSGLAGLAVWRRKKAA